MERMTLQPETGGSPAARVGGRLVKDVRADFPILSRRIGDKPLAYFDNAATTQKPRAVLDAVRFYYERTNANVHRSIHTLGEEATAAYEAARRVVQRFVGARSPEEIVFTRGATEAINLVASSWGGANLKPGDAVLLTEMEHHSNLVPWQLCAQRTGCGLRFIPVLPDGSLDLSVLSELWAEKVKMVAVAHVSNVLGTRNDVARLSRFAHEHGALILVDGAQAVPHAEIDVNSLGADFYAFSGHKVYGPMGIGALYARSPLLEAMPPYMGGGEMIKAVGLERSTWNDPPYKFEAGTPNVEGAVGLSAAISYIEGLGLSGISLYEGELGRLAYRLLHDVPGLRLHGEGSSGSTVISFTLDGIHPHDVAQFLDAEGIAIRAGHHCAQPLMRRLGVPATARASLCFYNTAEEVLRLADALVGAGRYFS
jgi:cysteine desulfurase/selenocysteine lyase